jgi:predicted glutamine amidotransferase
MTALVSRIRKSIFGLHEIWKDCRKKYPLYRYPYHGLNWVLTDGKTLIAMCYVNPGGFGKAKALGDRRQPYYQLQLSITPEEVYVASEPFDSTRPWKAMRHGELVIARRMKESVEIERQTL